jgi:NADH-quinone oxidoreductase subunit N
MSSPIVWIIFPGMVSVILLILQRSKMVVYISGTLVAVLLGGLAWLLPIGESISIVSISIPFGDTLVVLGRRFVLDANDRSTLLLIYMGLAFWLAGSWAARAGRLFVPLGIAIAGLLTAALTVEPFLYAALILQVVVLVSIPLINPPGSHSGGGVVRYLTYQTLGFPFILFTGWLISGVDSTIPNVDQALLAYVMMGIGFWLLLGIIPFHTWIPLFAEQSHPYAAAFLFYELPLAIMLFGLGFLDSYPWLQDAAGLYTILEIAGAMMILIAGLFAAFQTHLGRMFGYAVLVEIGVSLIAVRLGLQSGGTENLLGLFFAILLPRALSYGVWALALVALIRYASIDQNNFSANSTELTFRNIRGYGRRIPVAAFSLLLAHFSLAGLPLLVGFPVRLEIWRGTAQISVLLAGIVLAGYSGLVVGGIRSMAAMIAGSADNPWEINETRIEIILLVLGSFVLLLMGLLPQLFTPALAQMADIFLQNSP